MPRSYWVRVGPNPMTGVLMIRGNLDTIRELGRKSCDDGRIDWSDASTSQRKPKIAGTCAGKSQEKALP